MSTERELFEEWAVSNFYHVERSQKDNYVYENTRRMWDSCKARDAMDSLEDNALNAAYSIGRADEREPARAADIGKKSDRDGERYRWLRQCSYKDERELIQAGSLIAGLELDQVVDELMALDKKKTKHEIIPEHIDKMIDADIKKETGK